MAYQCPLKIKIGSQIFETILEGSLDIEIKSFQRSRASFILRDDSGTYTPVHGAEVMIADTQPGRTWDYPTYPFPDVLLFRGILKNYTKEKPSPSSETRFITIDCVDYLSILEDRLVAKVTYSNKPAQEILSELRALYMDEARFFTVGPPSEFVVSSITFDYCTVLEAIQRLADACGCMWWVDDGVGVSVNMTLIFMSDAVPYEIVQPQITEADVKEYKFSEDNPAYRNCQIVRSGEVVVSAVSTDEIGIYGRQVDNVYELKVPLPEAGMLLTAQSLLTRYSRPWRRLTYKIRRSGWMVPFTKVPVSLPEYTGDMWVDLIKVRDEGPVLWYEVQCVEYRATQLKDDWAAFFDGIANQETAQGFQVFSTALSVNGTGATLATTDAVLFGGSYPAKPHWYASTPVVEDDSAVRVPIFTSVYKWLRENLSSDYIGVILGIESIASADTWSTKVNFWTGGRGFEHTCAHDDWWEEEP